MITAKKQVMQTMALAGEEGPFPITPTLTISVDKTTASPGDTINITGYLVFSESDGDINDDGVINMRDIGYIAKHFGTKEGEPDWDAKCDLNVDGKVDMRDIAISIYRYGQNVANKPIIITEQTTGFEVTVYTSSDPYGYYNYEYEVPSDISTPSILYFQAYFPGGTYPYGG